MSAIQSDLTALSWCLGEIRESLARAEAALEAHLQDGGDDLSRVRSARTWLHQAHGALRIVDLGGVAAVTQEAEQLLDRAERGELALGGDAVGRLGSAFQAVVEFLEAAVAGSGDSPVALFPQYRALLELRSADRIEPADLYVPDLSVRAPRADRDQPLDSAGALAVRAAFERGLLGFLRHPEDAEALAGMHAAIARLNAAYQASGQRTFWWLAAAFFDALRARALPADLYAKRLVARVNLQIRRSLQHGDAIADRLLKDLLFMLARSGPGSAAADEARRLYRLAGTVPADFETPRYGVVDARALRQAREATTQAKVAWEKYVRGSAHDLPAFAAAAQHFDAAVARLPWPGLQRLAAAMAGLRRALAAAGTPLAELLALDVATALLFVEQSLERGARAVAEHDRRATELAERLLRLTEQQQADGEPMPEWLVELSRAAQDRLTTGALVVELNANLRACEKALDGFFRDPAQRADLPGLDRLLRQAAGALRLLGHDEAAGGADTVAEQVAAFAEAADPPDAAACERVAASVGALGFFVESLQQAGGAGGGFEFTRDDGRFVAELGEPPAAGAGQDEPPLLTESLAPAPLAPVRPPHPVEAAVLLPPFDVSAPVLPEAEPSADAGTIEVEVTEAPSLEALLAERRAGLPALLSDWSARPHEDAPRGALREALRAVRDESTLLDDASLRDAADRALEALDAVAVGEPPSPAADDAIRRVAGGASLPAATIEVRSDDAVDAELLAVFLDEAGEMLAAIDATSADSQATAADVGHLTTLRRGFHTLKGSSRMVGLVNFGEAAWAVEQVLNGWLADERSGTPALYELVRDAHASMREWIDRLRSDPAAPIEPAPLIAQAAAVRGVEPPPAPAPAATATPAPSAEVRAARGDAAAAADAAAEATVRIGERELPRALFGIFVDEARELLATLQAQADRWRAAQAGAADEASVRAAHTLAGSTRLVGLPRVREAAAALERFLDAQSQADAAPPVAEVDEYAWIVGRLAEALQRFAALDEPPVDDAPGQRATALAARWADGGGSPTPTADGHGVEAVEGLAALADDIDAELAPVFIEEADELLPRIGDALRHWQGEPADAAAPESLMRLLHTVKGSARMAGAMRLGQLVHAMETRAEAAIALPRVPAALIDDLVTRYDQVLVLYEAIRDPSSAQAAEAARTLTAQLDGSAVAGPVPGEPGDEVGLVDDGGLPDAASAADRTPVADHAAARVEADATDAVAADDRSDAARNAAMAQPTPAGTPAQPSQLIRVRADLLDRLVNEAGEVSIARARLDNAVGGIRQSLAELTENVSRLRSQLREIEVAADSRIHAGVARSHDADGPFDPLEFDRYTRFQELTRMLAESVSDVATVQQNALRHLDDAGRDLTRQTQVTRDLQQDLMRIRMVQFGSIADRLYRVVRQAAKELDKRVNLELRGAGAELDRSVLERMAGPIEHLLRNAVAHGIEPRTERLRAGKPETGEIALEVRQEANEVILTFADDGAGLNLGRIRERAVERGLLAADARPGDADLARLIFMPGFSTATEVTTLAGRGVGMDVVRAEVAAMGGRVEIDSTPGRGTRFTVHLPVSLAVAQVVLLTVGPMRVAVAAALVEQVLQLKPEALAAAYAQHQVEWQGQAVPLYFFGSLLELADCAPLAQRYSSVVVLRSGSQRIALHVDQVTPSQEVVVKHVGPQLARLTGIAGATVLGNGEIVLILNPVQIAATGRGQQAGQGDTAGFAPTRIEVAPTVMVVDDSVTVRKVTQRLLQREGYQVLLAKDGVDALRQLQDSAPDVMLLDIEMPRMDGFDLARNLRADERWSSLPIVMISSRTAEKHRSHALALGVDAFLGKPYDEAELLRQVRALAARRQACV
jgi:chemosensory pili system protein ChpA (sensor histidine kinase/response regulator)